MNEGLRRVYAFCGPHTDISTVLLDSPSSKNFTVHHQEENFVALAYCLARRTRSTLMHIFLGLASGRIRSPE